MDGVDDPAISDVVLAGLVVVLLASTVAVGGVGTFLGQSPSTATDDGPGDGDEVDEALPTAESTPANGEAAETPASESHTADETDVDTDDLADEAGGPATAADDAWHPIEDGLEDLPVLDWVGVTIVEERDGDVRSDDAVLVRSDGSIDGVLETTGSAVLRPDADVDGGVSVGGYLVVSEDGEIGGSARSGAHALLGSDAAVDGDLDVDGDLVLYEDAEVDGAVVSGAGVTLEEDASVDGDVRADGPVHLGEDAEVDGDVTGEAVELEDGAEVDGEITRTG